MSNLFTRDDTFFGVCQGIGEDTGVPVDLIRLALVPLLFLAPVATIGGYLAMGVVVFASRRLMPDRKAPAAPVAKAEPAPVAMAPEPLPLAA